MDHVFGHSDPGGLSPGLGRSGTLRGCAHLPVKESDRGFMEVTLEAQVVGCFHPSGCPHCFQDENPNPPCGLLDPRDLLPTSQACLTLLPAPECQIPDLLSGPWSPAPGSAFLCRDIIPLRPGNSQGRRRLAVLNQAGGCAQETSGAVWRGFGSSQPGSGRSWHPWGRA